MNNSSINFYETESQKEALSLSRQKDQVSIIIPNWNGKRFLPNCLKSLNEQSYPLKDIIVVDNGSTDGSVEFIEANYPQVKLIKFEINQGFSIAVNKGINSSSSEFVALLNNDTIVHRDWLLHMVRAIKQHRDVGSVGCKMLSYEDNALLDGAGDGYRRGGLPGRIGHREKDSGQFDQERFILGACGGAALYRRSMLDDIGLLDEEYFAYLEDVDLALRAQSRGYKCLYVPAAIVYHLGCGTTGSGYSPMVVKLSAQNNWNTIIKNIPGTTLLKFLPQILYWQLYYFAVVIVRGGQLLPWLKGTASAIFLLPSMLKKRQQIMKQRKVTIDYIEQIIVDSENELTASRERLISQELAQKAIH